jgi:large subunit ribosomal protein L2
MPVRKFKPTSPGRRFMTVSTFEEVTKSEPEKSLLGTRKRKAAATTWAGSRRATRAAATSAATA